MLAVAVLIIEGITFFYRWLRDRERPTPYDGYRTDEFFGLRWRWSWYARDVVGVHAFCPACDLQLEGRTQTAGIMDVPTGEVLYYCPCGATAIKLKCADPLQVERAIGLHAEREARSRGLLRD